jgi:natural product biosynthesis luciferase-like monooxygenase protein
MKFGILSLLDHYLEDKSEQQYYEDFLQEAACAEELGFDSVWIGEHHFGRYICPSPQVVAGALARTTRKMRIGTAVVLLPHHDPVRLAEDYAMVDLLSGGRLDFGVGRGFIKAIYDGFNQSMEESRDRFEEALEIIERAWREPTFSFEGRFRQVHNVSILPRPLQNPPPIWMAAAVSPESFVTAGKKGHSLLLALFALPLNVLKERVQLYRHTLVEAGFSPANFEIAAGYHGFVDETPEQARRKWEPHYMRYLHFVGSLVAPPEEIAGSQYEAWKQLGSHLRHVTFEQMYPNQVLCGDAAQCVDRIGLLREELGLDHLHMYMDLGGMDHGEVMRSLERFATRVIPQFR